MTQQKIISILVAAIYARYSCDQQRETSIEDQVRRCKEVATRMGLVIENWVIFTDSALSGQSHAQDKREGYQALLQAWDNNEFQLLIVDEFERLSRDDVEQALLRRRLKHNKRVRLITAVSRGYSPRMKFARFSIVSHEACWANWNVAT